jgi:hypothetical protein
MKNLVLLLISFLLAPVMAQERVDIPAPEVWLTGLVQSGTTRLATVTTKVGSRVVHGGQKLGDYVVDEIGNDSIVFRYDDVRFPIQSKNFTLPSAPTKTRRTLNVAAKLPRLRTGLMLAKLMERDILMDPEITGESTVIASNVTLEQALLKTFGFSPAERRGMIIVAKRPTSREALEVSPLNGVRGEVTFDFANAEMNYVLKVLADEAGMEISLPGRNDGSVWIYAKNKPVAELLPLILAIQDQPYSVQVEGNTLVVKRGR